MLLLWHRKLGKQNDRIYVFLLVSSSRRQQANENTISLFTSYYKLLNTNRQTISVHTLWYFYLYLYDICIFMTFSKATLERTTNTYAWITRELQREYTTGRFKVWTCATRCSTRAVTVLIRINAPPKIQKFNKRPGRRIRYLGINTIYATVKTEGYLRIRYVK